MQTSSNKYVKQNLYLEINRLHSNVCSPNIKCRHNDDELVMSYDTGFIMKFETWKSSRLWGQYFISNIITISYLVGIKKHPKTYIIHEEILPSNAYHDHFIHYWLLWHMALNLGPLWHQFMKHSRIRDGSNLVTKYMVCFSIMFNDVLSHNDVLVFQTLIIPSTFARALFMPNVSQLMCTWTMGLHSQ